MYINYSVLNKRLHQVKKTPFFLSHRHGKNEEKRKHHTRWIFGSLSAHFVYKSCQTFFFLLWSYLEFYLDTASNMPHFKEMESDLKSLMSHIIPNQNWSCSISYFKMGIMRLYCALKSIIFIWPITIYVVNFSKNHCITPSALLLP